MNWLDYHRSTKHSVESLKRTPSSLDWVNMPDPFRHYEGAPLLDLPADPSPPEVPAMQVLGGAIGKTTARDGPEFLSQLLFYSAAVSASKRVPYTTEKYALRVNPSSGNLHPTEFHFITRGMRQWADGLYHYRPSSHMTEQRALGEISVQTSGISAPAVFVLSSIAWREAWKYGERAYRYCLLDIGHAWQALTLAARAIGYASFAKGHFSDVNVASAYNLSEDEWPMLMITLAGACRLNPQENAGEVVWHGGTANRLSKEITSYPLIEQIHSATKRLKKNACAGPERLTLSSAAIKLPSETLPTPGFGAVARTRRSALDFQGGDQFMSLAELSATLSVGSRPLQSDFTEARFVQLYLYVHRVTGLGPGLYRHWAETNEVEQLKSGDQRVAAAGLSLGQDLAGNACVAFSMVADLKRATCKYGDRGYRYVHFEAGAIGHRLYLAAEALGLRATGIGAFFDDAAADYLGLAPGRQVVYHFAIGFPVPDERLAA